MSAQMLLEGLLGRPEWGRVAVCRLRGRVLTVRFAMWRLG